MSEQQYEEDDILEGITQFQGLMKNKKTQKKGKSIFERLRPMNIKNTRERKENLKLQKMIDKLSGRERILKENISLKKENARLVKEKAKLEKTIQKLKLQVKVMDSKEFKEYQLSRSSKPKEIENDKQAISKENVKEEKKQPIQREEIVEEIKIDKEVKLEKEPKDKEANLNEEVELNKDIDLDEKADLDKNIKLQHENKLDKNIQLEESKNEKEIPEGKIKLDNNSNIGKSGEKFKKMMLKAIVDEVEKNEHPLNRFELTGSINDIKMFNLFKHNIININKLEEYAPNRIDVISRSISTLLIEGYVEYNPSGENFRLSDKGKKMLDSINEFDKEKDGDKKQIEVKADEGKAVENSVVDNKTKLETIKDETSKYNKILAETKNNNKNMDKSIKEQKSKEKQVKKKSKTVAK